MSLVLSIDLGTSGCRSAVFDSKLTMMYSARAEYPLSILSEQEVEQDANLWWKAVKRTVQEVTRKLGTDSSNIKSVGISSQGIALVPVDVNGDALCQAISWLDNRASVEAAEIIEHYGMQEIFSKTGKRISASYTLPKLMWMRKNKRDIYDKAYKFLLPLDFIQNKLCGNCMTDHSMAAGTMMYDIHDCRWMESLLDENGISTEKLSKIAWAGSIAGIIKADVALELGLSNNVLVVVGAQDQKCAAYGGGVTEQVVTISLGTGSCISKLMSIPQLDEKMRMPVFSYLWAGCWDIEGVINNAGSALEWFRDKFAPNMDFSTLTKMAAVVDTGAVKFYPYLSGEASPYWGTGLGAFTGLTFKSGIAECVRAILEGIAYHISANIEIMDKQGLPAKELHVFGGGAKSDLWCEIIANVTNRRVLRLQSCETALVGAAKLAFSALGESTGDLNVETEFYPQLDQTRRYEQKYKEYEVIRKCCFDTAAEME